MAVLNHRFNWSSELRETDPILFRQLSDAYEDTANVVNGKSSTFISDTDPLATSSINANLNIGDSYVNTATNTAWMMTSRVSSVTVTWTKIT